MQHMPSWRTSASSLENSASGTLTPNTLPVASARSSLQMIPKPPPALELNLIIQAPDAFSSERIPDLDRALFVQYEKEWTKRFPSSSKRRSGIQAAAASAHITVRVDFRGRLYPYMGFVAHWLQPGQPHGLLERVQTLGFMALFKSLANEAEFGHETYPVISRLISEQMILSDTHRLLGFLSHPFDFKLFDDIETYANIQYKQSSGQNIIELFTGNTPFPSSILLVESCKPFELFAYVTSLVEDPVTVMAFFINKKKFVDLDTFLDWMILRITWALQPDNKNTEAYLNKWLLVMRHWLAHYYIEDILSRPDLEDRLTRFLQTLIIPSSFLSKIDVLSTNSILFYLESEGTDQSLPWMALSDGGAVLQLEQTDSEPNSVPPSPDFNGTTPQPNMPIHVRFQRRLVAMSRGARRVLEHVSSSQKLVETESENVSSPALSKTSNISLSLMLPASLLLTQHSSETIARQLCLYCQELLSQLERMELIDAFFCNKPKEATTVGRLTDYCNAVTQWTVDQILKEAKVQQQIETYQKLVRIAYKCLTYGNFCDAANITQALDGNVQLRPIWRHWRTANCTPSSFESQLMNLLRPLNNPDKNFQHLRKLMNEAYANKKPHIIAPAIFLRDLTINGEVPLMDRSGRVNVRKIALEATTIQRLLYLNATRVGSHESASANAYRYTGWQVDTPWRQLWTTELQASARHANLKQCVEEGMNIAPSKLTRTRSCTQPARSKSVARSRVASVLALYASLPTPDAIHTPSHNIVLLSPDDLSDLPASASQPDVSIATVQMAPVKRERSKSWRQSIVPASSLHDNQGSEKQMSLKGSDSHETMRATRDPRRATIHI